MTLDRGRAACGKVTFFTLTLSDEPVFLIYVIRWMDTFTDCYPRVIKNAVDY